jgi:hypothetical protein
VLLKTMNKISSRFGKRISVETVVNDIFLYLDDYLVTKYPQTPNGLQFRIKHRSNFLELTLDENCCIITIDVDKDEDEHTYNVTIVLGDLMYTKSKTKCPRSGNQYLSIINDLNENLFSKIETYGVGDNDGINVTFTVGVDAATIPGIPNLYIHDTTFRRTEWIANGGSFRTIDIDDDYILQRQIDAYTEATRAKTRFDTSIIDREEDLPVRVRDHHSDSPRRRAGCDTLRLRDVVDMSAVRTKPEWYLFFEHVLKHEWPEIYDGSINVSRLASLLVGDERSTSMAASTIHSQIIRLIAHFWYTYVVTNENSVSGGGGVVVGDNTHYIPGVYLSLSTLTLLTRDDCKTWYMDKLGLETCSPPDSGATLNPCEQIQEFQGKEIVNLKIIGTVDFKRHVRSLTNVRDTMVAIIDRSKRTADRLFTFYDAYVYFLIAKAFETSLEDRHVFTNDVCRKLLVVTAQDRDEDEEEDF